VPSVRIGAVQAQTRIGVHQVGEGSLGLAEPIRAIHVNRYRADKEQIGSSKWEDPCVLTEPICAIRANRYRADKEQIGSSKWSDPYVLTEPIRAIRANPCRASTTTGGKP
jgi:hypothetical protein